NSFDFNGDSEELYVEIKYSNLSESDKTTFQKYVSADNSITVRKTARRDGSFNYNGFIQEPEEEWLKESNISEYNIREKAEELPLYKFLPDSGRITIASFKYAQEEYIKENLDELNFSYTLEDSNFMGAANVAKGIFGDLFFIPSV